MRRLNERKRRRFQNFLRSQKAGIGSPGQLDWRSFWAHPNPLGISEGVVDCPLTTDGLVSWFIHVALPARKG